MKVSLPYFRNRRYLRGIDWVVGALHEDARKRVGVGAVSQAIIEVEGLLDPVRIRAALDQISNRFPLIHGRFARDWFNLAPYWKVPRRAVGRSIPSKRVDILRADGKPAWPQAVGMSIPLEVRGVPADGVEEADRLLAEHVNRPFQSDSQHLRFMLVRLGGEGSKLGLVFDHRLLDAYGAESFFRLMDETFGGRLEEVAPKISVTEPAHLDHWKRRMGSGRMLNRLLIELQKKEVCGLEMPEPLSGRGAKFVHDAMTGEESARAIGKAFGEIGVPVLLPCAAARAVAAVGRLGGSGVAKGEAGAVMPSVGSGVERGGMSGQYLLFTTVNMRTPGDEWGSMFWNHFSFLLFSAPCDAGMGVAERAGVLRDQLFSHMKDQMPAAMEDAAALGRIFPRPLVAKVINSMFKGRMCSFYFACLKESGYPGAKFMGNSVVNLVHTPLAFAPPGLNLCMTWYGDHFNLVLSYLDGAIEDGAARGVLRGFKGLLVE